MYTCLCLYIALMVVCFCHCMMHAKLLAEDSELLLYKFSACVWNYFVWQSILWKMILPVLIGYLCWDHPPLLWLGISSGNLQHKDNACYILKRWRCYILKSSKQFPQPSWYCCVAWKSRHVGQFLIISSMLAAGTVLYFVVMQLLLISKILSLNDQHGCSIFCP